jgi:hypothetical protein
MALEVGGCKNPFPYWLAKFNVMKKSAKMLSCSQSQNKLGCRIFYNEDGIKYRSANTKPADLPSILMKR